MKRFLLLLVGLFSLSLSIAGNASKSTTVPWNEIKGKKVIVLKANGPIA